MTGLDSRSKHPWHSHTSSASSARAKVYSWMLSCCAWTYQLPCASCSPRVGLVHLSVSRLLGCLSPLTTGVAEPHWHLLPDEREEQCWEGAALALSSMEHSSLGNKMLMYLGWLVVSLLPSGPYWFSCIFCAKGCSWREMPEACLASSAGGVQDPWGWVNIFPVCGKLCSRLGFPGWSSCWPDPLPGLK